MYYIGVDLGGTNIAIGIVDESLKIIRKGSVRTCPNREPELIIKDMAALASRLLSETGVSLSEVEYVGIAAPGTADRDRGVVVYANNLPFLNFPIAEVFRKFLPVKKVLIENDANAAALAEHRAGVAKGTKNMVMITLGTGVGGGIIIDGKVHSGFNFAGAELGHTVIVHENAKACSCGRQGCFEAYASATGLTNLTREKIAECRKNGTPTLMFKDADMDRVSARTAFSAMKQGDLPAKEVVDAFISYLACGVSNIIHIFRPEMLVIGGGVCNERENLTVPLSRIVDRECYTEDTAVKTKIAIAELGNDAGIIGAAALGL